MSETVPTKGLDFSATETKWGFKGKNYLFVIGIDKYSHWPPLNCAVKDIDDFTQVLFERYQFKKENLIVLKDEQATEQNILRKFKDLYKIITPEDNLIVYFSGHGHYDEETKSGYWIPVNAQLGNDNEHQYLDTSIIANRLKGINSLHTFLIIDACFSGTMVTQLKSAHRSERYKSRKILTSGRAEVVSDGPVGGNSPFAKGILVTLEKNTDLHLRASRLIVDVVEYVENQAKQTPTNGVLFNSDDQGGDFVFHLKLKEDSFWKYVIANHSRENYKKYLELYPKGKHVIEARRVIKDGEERGIGPAPDLIAWLKLRSNPTYKEYLEFTETYPMSEFLREAVDEMTRLDNIAYNKLKLLIANGNKSRSTKVEACQNYFKNYPKAKNDLNVRKILNILNLTAP